ncbi:hypothetical protein [Nostoc sp.]|uniref:hypothetical protein n=1 Tax=Nostoc sp. TaxID=1180 RepID=UPI002FFAC448
MPNTSLREAAPTTRLLFYERLRQRCRSVQVSTSAQCPMPNAQCPIPNFKLARKCFNDWTD